MIIALLALALGVWVGCLVAIARLIRRAESEAGVKAYRFWMGGDE